MINSYLFSNYKEKKLNVFHHRMSNKITYNVMYNLINVYDRDKSHPCVTSFTTTLDMRRKDVVYGSRVGNTTNPQFLEINSWVNGSILNIIIMLYLLSCILMTQLCQAYILPSVSSIKKYLFWLI